ncbi:MAG: fadB, partial [Labilithrix sp.]|nr:fadB [Labilithrix sp.]
MASDVLTYTLEGNLAIVRMDDGKANALSEAMIDGLLDALARAEKEASAMVLVGRPDRFCAGFDLRVMMSSPDAAKALLTRGSELLMKLYGAKVPLVIACTGHALAGGALVLLTGDVRIGAEGAYRIGLNEPHREDRADPGDPPRPHLRSDSGGEDRLPRCHGRRGRRARSGQGRSHAARRARATGFRGHEGSPPQQDDRPYRSDPRGRHEEPHDADGLVAATRWNHERPNPRSTENSWRQERVFHSLTAVALFLAEVRFADHIEQRVELAYIAHSERCALLLDGEGICRWVVPKVGDDDEMIVAARRCVGAQFVATLDPDAPGLMGHEPRAGTNLLFALVKDGRVALVRFGPVQSFEELDAPREAHTSEPATASAPAAEPPTKSEPSEPSVEPEAAATPAALPVAAESEPMPPTRVDVPELDDVIASFSRDSSVDVRALDEEEASSLDALAEALPLPASQSPIAVPEPGKGPDDSQLGIVTNAFKRDSMAAMFEEIDLEIDTGSFARVEVTSDPFMAETERTPMRSSGF